MRPIVSAVIPTKSNPSGLRATVEALWAIDADRIEVIVVDGGGCDETKAWLLEHQDYIQHIRSAADGGVYEAMNYGLQCAGGNYVWFAGAGDLPDASTWREFLGATTETDERPQLLVFGVAIGEDREGGVPAHYPGRWDASMYWRNTTHHQGVLYTRELIQARRFDPSLRVLADYALHLSMWVDGLKAEVREATWALAASGGLSRQFNADLYREEWRFKRKMLKGWRKAFHPIWLASKYAIKQVMGSR
jgi:glycosyltransferase involved in cell wall biosynthesis